MVKILKLLEYRFIFFSRLSTACFRAAHQLGTTKKHYAPLKPSRTFITRDVVTDRPCARIGTLQYRLIYNMYIYTRIHAPTVSLF